jgi:7-cyano-7-deazaguanine synthase
VKVRFKLTKHNKSIMPLDATILMSGGIDSTACAHFLKHHGNAIRGVFVDYGQAAAISEWTAVHSLAKYLGVPLSVYHVIGSQSFSSGELGAAAT